ncbi:hypothetical protein BH24PSE2_BH24PSE2_17280 [soil metagenome]
MRSSSMLKKPPRRDLRQGFTLVEVMVALSIVAIGMLAAFSAVNQIVSDTTYLREKTLADWVAMNQLTDVRLEGGLPDIGESDGEVELAGQSWRWVTRISETPVENLRRIDVEVALANEPDQTLVQVAGFTGSALNLRAFGNPWLTGAAGAAQPGVFGEDPEHDSEGAESPPEDPGPIDDPEPIDDHD